MFCFQTVHHVVPQGTDTVLIAASNAHSDCVRVLHELKADINAVSEVVSMAASGAVVS